MKHYAVWISIFAVPFLTQCTSLTTPTTNAVTGPFDSRGNYVEAWADTPSKWYRPSSPSTTPSVAPSPVQTAPVQYVPVSPPQSVALQPRPKVTPPTVVASKPKPKVVAKPKPKPKPVLVRYTIKRGDSLGRIASKYGVSVTALRRANRISGDVIHPGKVLTIPK